MGVPYYPQSTITPNLGLELKGMDEVIADDFIILDAFAGTAQSIQINGSVIPLTNFIDSNTVTFTVAGNNVSAHAAAVVDVNGAPIAAPNFNNLAPAAPPGGTNVLWQVLGGSISAYVVIPAAGVFPVTEAAIASNWLNSYNSVTGLFTATQPNYTDIAGVVPTPPSGSVLWSAIGNAAGALVLANANFATTFNQTSAVPWTWANTTAASVPVITSGLGAVNKTNTQVGGVQTLNINIGDFVYVFIEGAASATAMNDNGASGGNTYTHLIALDTNVYGYCSVWVCASATKSATNITATIGTLYAMLSATFLNVTGVGATHLDTANSHTPAVGAVTTTGYNSVVIASFSVNGTYSSSTPNGLFVGGGSVITQVVPSPGVATTSITYTGGGAQWLVQSLELLAQATIPQASPILKLSGTYWNGSASATDSWSIQDVINPTTSVSTLTFTHTGSSGVAAVHIPLFDNVPVVSAGVLSFNADAGISRLGAGSLAIGNGTAANTTGNLSLNRISKAGADFAGQATVTAGGTTKAVSFGANYAGAGQPVILLTPTSDPLALGVPVGYWVTYSGGAGAWTGFTVNIQTALAGDVVFNYIVVGVA